MATLKGFDLQASLNTLAGTKDRDAQDAANAWADATGYDLVGALNKKAGTTDFDLNGVCTKLLHATSTYESLPTGYDAQAALTLLAQVTTPSQFIAYAVQGGSSDFSTTKELKTTGASLVIVFGCETGANYEDTTVFSSDPSNTFTQLAWSNTVSGVVIGYKKTPTTSSTQTFSFGDGVPTDPSGGALVVKTFGALDVHAEADSDQPGSITPNTNGELIVCVAGSASTPSGAVSINEDFTILKGVSAAASTSKTLYIAYLIQATAGAVNPTWSGIPNCQSAIAAFKAT